MFRRLILLPLSFAYGVAIRLRHMLFDSGVLRSRPGALRTIVLGNLTVGGTGKTPTTERIVRDMQNLIGLKKVGILSRGYGRKTKGFRWVSESMDSADCGDEPLLLSKNLPDVPVAVCEKRLVGLRNMKAKHPELEWVVCDDAFQHRRLRPTLSILLLDATQPVAEDDLLPLGRLRDLPERMNCADALVITRLNESENLQHAAEAHGVDQRKTLPLFASHMQPQPLLDWPAGTEAPNGNAALSPDRRERIMAVAGIARPERFMDRLTERFQVVRRECFPDHRAFTEKDYKRWRRIMEGDRIRAIITTEKDAMRIKPELTEGINIRCEAIKAEWHDSEAFALWLREAIARCDN
jgi:tetraacyldisaccharide 4'-kinase